jgi:hypothetical protein
VEFDGGAGSLPGAGEVVLDPFESTRRDLEVVAGRASLAAWRSLETTLCAGVVASSLDGTGFCRTQGAAVISGPCCDVGQCCIRCGDCGGCLGSSSLGGGCRRFGGGEGVLGVGEEGRPRRRSRGR